LSTSSLEKVCYLKSFAILLLFFLACFFLLFVLFDYQLFATWQNFETLPLRAASAGRRDNFFSKSDFMNDNLF